MLEHQFSIADSIQQLEKALTIAVNTAYGAFLQISDLTALVDCTMKTTIGNCTIRNFESPPNNRTIYWHSLEQNFSFFRETVTLSLFSSFGDAELNIYIWDCKGTGIRY